MLANSTYHAANYSSRCYPRRRLSLDIQHIRVLIAAPLRVPLTSGIARLLTMELDVSRLTATVLDRWRSFYFLVGNRRRYERQPLSGNVTITYRNGNHDTVKHQCSCIDWSPRGFALICPEAVPVETSVQLLPDSSKLTTFGQVRYCHPRYLSFR